jgi:DNA-binding MarR family transcriptional regulator
MKLDLDNYLPGLLLWLSNKVSSSASSLYREKFQIAVTDWRLLSYFLIYPWSTASKAAELMGLDKASISRSIALLVKNGWLTNRPLGLRKIEYKVTPSGVKLHNAVFKVAMAREKALLDGFSEEEKALVISMMHRMLNNLKVLEKVGREKRQA